MKKSQTQLGLEDYGIEHLPQEVIDTVYAIEVAFKEAVQECGITLLPDMETPLRLEEDGTLLLAVTRAFYDTSEKVSHKDQLVKEFSRTNLKAIAFHSAGAYSTVSSFSYLDSDEDMTPYWVYKIRYAFIMDCDPPIKTDIPDLVKDIKESTNAD